MAEKKIKIDDIAKLAGCSTGTVSRVINNRPDVSPVTRKKVLKVMEKVGYRPNAIAQSLASSQSHTVALIIPNNTTPFLGSMALAIDRQLYANNYTMMLSNTYWDPEIEYQKIMHAKARGVDGIILKPCCEDAERYSSFGLPIVIVSQTWTGNINCIDIENDMVGYLGANHLLECGYRRPAFIGGDLGTSVVQARLAGFNRALQEQGIDSDKNLIRYGDYNIETGYKITTDLLNLACPPDAVFTCSDTVALGAIQAAVEKDVCIPKRLGVLGMNNDAIGALPYVSLSTIDQSVDQMGELAAKMMMDMITAGEDWKPQKILLYPKLIMRSSTCKLSEPSKKELNL